jgi:phospholipid-binding lipoprotein MlaA
MKKLFILFLILAWPLTVLGEDGNPVASGSTETTATEDNGDGDDGAFLFDDEITEDGEDDEFLFDEEFDEDEVLISDPLEPMNRAFFWFNDKLYFYLLKPVARGWRWITPEPWRIGVQNVFSNLATPVRFINAGLQGKFNDAGNELTRFVVNSTIGIGGLFDTAKDHFDIRKKDEDTGQTLGHYGVGPGFYLVLPIFGPSNARDAVGLVVDSRMDILFYISEGRTYWGLKAFDKVNDLSLDRDTYEGIKRDALDSYLFVRDAFIQYRQNKIDH